MAAERRFTGQEAREPRSQIQSTAIRKEVANPRFRSLQAAALRLAPIPRLATSGSTRTRLSLYLRARTPHQFRDFRLRTFRRTRRIALEAQPTRVAIRTPRAVPSRIRSVPQVLRPMVKEQRLRVPEPVMATRQSGRFLDRDSLTSTCP